MINDISLLHTKIEGTNYTYISRCSKLFYIILSKYFYFALRSCTAFVCPALSHIARYAPSHRTNNYGTITQFKCKNNFEHLLTKLDGKKNMLLLGFKIAQSAKMWAKRTNMTSRQSKNCNNYKRVNNNFLECCSIRNKYLFLHL